MKRFQGNPILKPIEAHDWESRNVFNASATYIDGRVHILYRAIGNDGISRLGYAASADGCRIEERLPSPVFMPSSDLERHGCEDPRLILLDNRCVMTYTAYERSEDQHAVYQIAMTSIDVKDFVNKQWKWGVRSTPFPGILNKDAVIFPKKINGKYLMFHRLEPGICGAYSDDLQHWCDIKMLMMPRLKTWDSLKIGAAGPPIELNEGWLFIYHGVTFDKVYSLGAMLLDKHNPEIILYRSENPILAPVDDCEKFGKVPNVVFSCGNIFLDDKFFIYYGGADSVLCVATYDLSELLPKI